MNNEMNKEECRRLKENFKNRNIDVEYFNNLEDVKLFILNIIPTDCKVGIGHSATIQQMNITNSLMQRGNTVYDKELAKDKVLIVVGVNKIVNTVEEGIKRVKNIACPLNAKRVEYNPPCVELKKCIECSSKERVCNYLSIIEGQAEPNRIQLCIVNMECGF